MEGGDGGAAALEALIGGGTGSGSNGDSTT